MFSMVVAMEKLANFILILHLITASLALQLDIKQESIERNMEQCKKLTKNPYFEPDMVVGKPWRVYYTWNMKIDTRCVEMVFKNATPAIIHRFWTDMAEYVEEQPYWDSASLVVTTGTTRHEMLLLPDQGAAGAFIGVPNVIRGGGTPIRGGVPLLKFHLKLVRNGKYLAMMDCHVGVVSLSARTEHPPYRSEIAAAVAELDIGDGYPACTDEKNKDEQFFIE